ncbi:MAG: ABC transporter permease [Eubacteriales bacterium]|nr:ABC transporter permease [Eubacteriales bacterium]
MRNKINFSVFLPLIALVAITGIFAVLTKGKIITTSNLSTIFDQSLVLFAASVGVTFVMATGSLDFSQGSMLAICCLAGVYTARVSFLLAAVVMVALGGLIGLINGVIVAKFKVKSFIVTICMMCILRGLNIFLMTSTGSVGAPLGLSIMLDNMWFKVVVFVVVMLIATWLFHFRIFGRNCRAMGAGELAAIYSGVNASKTRVLAFVMAGLMCGVASFMMIVRTGMAAPATGKLMETDILASLVLGGLPITGGAKSKVWCGIVGALLLSMLSNGLTIMGAGTHILQLVKGIIFLMAVSLSIEKKSSVVIK